MSEAERQAIAEAAQALHPQRGGRFVLDPATGRLEQIAGTEEAPPRASAEPPAAAADTQE